MRHPRLPTKTGMDNIFDLQLVKRLRVPGELIHEPRIGPLVVAWLRAANGISQLMPKAQIEIKPGTRNHKAVRPLFFQHQLPIGIDLQRIPRFIGAEGNRKMKPIGESIEIILRARVAAWRDQIAKGRYRRSIERVGPQLHLQASMRKKPLVAVGPGIAFKPDRHPAMQSVILIDILTLFTIYLDNVGPVISRYLRELKKRHIRSPVPVSISMDLIFIHFYPPLHRKVSARGLQYMRGFTDQVRIGECKSAPLHAVGGKLRPTETFCNLQWQVPLRVLIIIIGTPPGENPLQRTRPLERNPQDVVGVRLKVRKLRPQHCSVGDQVVSAGEGIHFVRLHPGSEVGHRDQICLQGTRPNRV